MEPVETIEHRGHEIKVYHDDDPQDCRKDWDHVGTMVCFHSRYNLGDEHRKDDPEDFMRELACEVDPTAEGRMDYWENAGHLRLIAERTKKGMTYSEACSAAVKASDEYVKDIIESAIDKYVMILPLFLYDHSGITISTGRFSCPWDSGQVGYIYITRERMLKEWSAKKLTKKLKAKAYEIMESEVHEYDHFLTGNVYGYQVEGELCDDSCWGFYGSSYDDDSSWDYMIDEAKGQIDWAINAERKKHIKQIKTWIRNHVPLHHREPMNALA